MLSIINKSMPLSKYPIKCPYSMKPSRIVIHNTANDASSENEIAFMQRNNNECSFHFAVDDKHIIQGLLLNRNGWHAGDGNGKGNREGIGIEICYSKSGGEKFKKAQENAAELTAYLLGKYGWDISNVTKHEDYQKKHCPHRTLDEYGWQFFLNLVSSFLNKAKNKYPVTEHKSESDLAKEVIMGKWGNGQDRINRLKNAGYNYTAVQSVVDMMLKKSVQTTTRIKKSNEQIANEVIKGKWGNGQDRKSKLTQAGYNYSDIQSIVNRILDK